MSGAISTKLLPHNVAALRRGQTPEAATHVTAGNPISTANSVAIWQSRLSV